MPYKEISFQVFIYLIEDDPDMAAFALEMVKEILGIDNIESYTSPEKFLEELKDGTSIIVVDHYLNSDFTGLDITRKVKAKNKNSYVIVMSAQQSHSITKQYINAHADHYIDKNDYPPIETFKKMVEELKAGLIEAKDRIETEKIKQERALKALKVIEDK